MQLWKRWYLWSRDGHLPLCTRVCWTHLRHTRSVWTQLKKIITQNNNYIHLPIKKNVFTLHDYQNYNSDVLSLSDGHFVSLSSTACDDWKYGDNCNIPCQCNTTYADRWGYEISEKSKRIVFILQSFEEKVPCLFTCITFNGSCALN